MDLEKLKEDVCYKDLIKLQLKVEKVVKAIGHIEEEKLILFEKLKEIRKKERDLLQILKDRYKTEKIPIG